MAQTTIQPEHLPHLARQQHVLEWLQGERARLEQELRHVLRQGEQQEHILTAFLRSAYDLDAQSTPYTLDVEQGVITTPDIPRAQEQPPTSE